jgi:outer membrane protein TolC
MYVFGSKLTSREATFNDFGFNEFLNGLGGAMMTSEGTLGDFTNFAQNMSNPQNQQNLLNTQPNNLNYPDDRNNFETSVTYEVPLFVGFKIENAKKMASLQILANEVKHSFDRDLLGLEVLKAYNGAVASKFFIKATKKAKEATSSYVNFANALHKEGLVTDIDVKQAKAYDANINAKSLQASNNYELSLAYLRFLVDRDDIDDVNGFENIEVCSKDLATLQSDAIENRSDLKWMNYNVETMNKKIAMDSSDFYPTVGMQIKYGFNDNSLTFDGDKDSYLIAIGASYSLFDGGTRDAIKERAKIDYNETKLYHEYMKNGIKLEVEKNFLSYETLKAQLKEKKIEATLADEVLEQSTEMYKNSLLNMTQLLMQEAKAEKSRAELIKAKYDVAQASAKLQISIGNSLESN